MSDETADVLDDAADYIEKHGWTRGAYIRRDGRVCALGAIGQVRDDIGRREAANRALRATIGTTWIAGWNDRHNRTKEQVLDAFRLAAKQERIAADAGERP